MTVLRIIKFILFIVLLPIWIPLISFRIWYYRKVLVRNMIQSGIPKEYAKQLGKEVKLRDFIKIALT